MVGFSASERTVKPLSLILAVVRFSITVAIRDLLLATKNTLPDAIDDSDALEI
jgi:hypothetical protein